MSWESVLPLLTVAATVAGMLWVLMRLFRPMAVQVANETSQRLQDHLEHQTFRGIEQRFDRMDKRIEKGFDQVDAQLNRDGRAVSTGGRAAQRH